jgi:hypothetical protein
LKFFGDSGILLRPMRVHGYSGILCLSGSNR